jgi:hypothetical protein
MPTHFCVGQRRIKMGETRLLYDPKTINWEARSRVEAWTRHDSDINFNTPERKIIKASIAYGIVFVIGTTLALGVSLYRLLG